jgi:hypothetical protein
MFEVGDKVTPVESSINFTAGAVYTVKGVDRDGDPIIINDKGLRAPEFASRFKRLKGEPSHYSSPNGDVWSTVGAFFSDQSRIDHHRLNAVEYIIRCFDKGGVEDLKKAKVNLDRAIEMMEEQNV